MHGSALRQAISARPVWRMPLGPDRYDRGPLSSAERTALAVLVDGDAAANTRTRRTAEAALGRLSRPLHEVYALRRTEPSRRTLATRVVFGQMHRRGSTFWQWSTHDWCDVVGATTASLDEVHGIGPRRCGIRPPLPDLAQLPCR